MERFIHSQNLEHYRKLLTQTTDEAQQQQILKLLAVEESKDCQPPIQKIGHLSWRLPKSSAPS
jgi:hypothetical protein